MGARHFGILRKGQTSDQVDTEKLNQSLSARGDVNRAMFEMLMGEINELRQAAGLPRRTRPQIITALKAKMR